MTMKPRCNSSTTLAAKTSRPHSRARTIPFMCFAKGLGTLSRCPTRENGRSFRKHWNSSANSIFVSSVPLWGIDFYLIDISERYLIAQRELEHAVAIGLIRIFQDTNQTQIVADIEHDALIFVRSTERNGNIELAKI